LALTTLAVVALLGYALGYVDATNSVVRTYTAVFNAKNDDQDFDSDRIPEKQTDLLIFYGMVVGVCLLIQALLNMLLTVGVRKADHRKLNLWLAIHLILLFLNIYSFFRGVYMGQTSTNDVVAKLGGLFYILGSLLAIKYYRDGLVVSASTTPSAISFVTSEKIPYMKV